MLKSRAKWAAAWALCIMLQGTASARQPGWTIDTIYSNGSGTVQFIVLTVARNEGPLAFGSRLVARDAGSGVHEYRFLDDVPVIHEGRKVLVGTEDFARSGLIRTDYVVPNGFLFGRGTLALTEGPLDEVTDQFEYTNMGIKGAWGIRRNALDKCYAYYYPFVQTICIDDFLWISPPIPALNNAGDSAIVLPGGLENFGGLWWAAPAGSQSGWSLGVEHQENIVAASWTTYDEWGAPTWYFIPRALRVERQDDPYIAEGLAADGFSFVGSIYSARGPAFGATPFDPMAVQLTEVGRAAFRFPRVDDHGVGMFRYSLDGKAETYQPITLEYFGDPDRWCRRGDYEGMWWNPAESGWGMYIAHQREDLAFATWLTYDLNGQPTWFILYARRSPASAVGNEVYAGTIYRAHGPPRRPATNRDWSLVQVEEAGSGSLAFSTYDAGRFAFSVGSVTESHPIERQIFARRQYACN